VATVAAVPAIEAATNSIEKSQASEVKMSSLVDRLSTLDAFGNLPAYQALLDDPSAAGLIAALGDSTSAVPLYLALLNGDTGAVGELASVDALPVFANAAYWDDLNYLTPGYDNPLTPEEDPSPGYDALGALPLYLAAANGDPSALVGIDAVSATPNWASFLSTGDTSATGLGGIDAFSAIPVYKQLATGDHDAKLDALSQLSSVDAIPVAHDVIVDGDINALEPIEDVQPGYAALGAIPGLLGTNQAPLAAKNPGPVVEQAAAPEVENAGATEKTVKEEKKDNGNLGLFKPKTEVILPTGFGGGGADNGMPGWNNMLKKLGVGGDESGSEGGGDAG
jgi:hypothetical protein